MHLTLILADKEWNKLAEEAEKLYPNKGISHMITMELHKHVKNNGGGEVICATMAPPATIVQKNYNVPAALVDPLNCMSESLKMSAANFVIRKIIQPHLNKK